MKTWIMVMVMGLFGITAFAQPQGRGRPCCLCNQCDPGDRRAKMLERFDSDGDGELSLEERQALRKTVKGRGDRGPGPRRPADGGNRGDWRQTILEKFDADGDGELSREEHRELSRAMKGGQGKGRPGKDKIKGKGKGNKGNGQGKNRPDNR